MGEFVSRIFALLILLGIILTSCAMPSTEETLHVDKGTADRSSLSYAERSGMLPLRGEWIFLPGRLLEPEAIRQETPEYMAVPMSWDAQHGLPPGLDGGRGYGTYYLRILLHPDEVNRPLGLLLDPIASSYRLWVNGNLVRTVGTVGENSDLSIPDERTEFVYFTSEKPEVEVVIQTANFAQRKGGIWSGIYIGSAKALGEQTQLILVREAASAGALLTMGLFYLAFAILYLPERSTLFLGMLSVSLALRIFLLNGVLIDYWFPDLAWDWQVKLEYMTEIVAVLSASRYIRALFPQEFSRRAIQAVQAFEAMFALLVVLAPTSYFTQWMIVHVAVAACAILYMLCVVYPKAIRNRRLGARTGLIGGGCLLAALVHDVFYYLGLPFSSTEMIYAGFFAYLLSQMTVTIRRYVKLQQESVALKKRLAVTIERLEETVSERTKQLMESHRENARLMHNIAHDLRAPIGVIRNRASQIRAYVSPEGEQHLQVIEQKTDWAVKLAQNLNDLAAMQEDEIRYAPVNVTTIDLMRMLYKKSEPAVCTGGFRWSRKPLVELFDAAVTRVRVDMHLMERVLDNLISNALKFTPAGGLIRVAYRIEGRHFIIDAENESHPVAEETLELMFERLYRGCHAAAGTGIGLAVCREIVLLHGGDIRVRQHAGTICLSIRLPLA